MHNFHTEAGALAGSTPAFGLGSPGVEPLFNRFFHMIITKLPPGPVYKAGLYPRAARFSGLESGTVPGQKPRKQKKTSARRRASILAA